MKKNEIIKYFCERSGVEFSNNLKNSDVNKNEKMFIALCDTIMKFGVDTILENKFKKHITLNELSKRHSTIAGEGVALEKI